MDIDRRDFMKLAGVGGIVLVSALGGRILGSYAAKTGRVQFRAAFGYPHVRTVRYGISELAIPGA
jgi:hypothetical protein